MHKSCAGQQVRSASANRPSYRGLFLQAGQRTGRRRETEAHCLQEVDVTNGDEAGGWARGEPGLATDAFRASNSGEKPPHR